MNAIQTGSIDRRAILTVAACVLVSVSEGFDLASMALSGPSIIRAFQLDRVEFGFVATTMMGGFFLGSSIGGTIGDRHGRKRVLLLGMAIAAISSLLSVYAQSLVQLLLVRFLTGLGIGAVFPNMLAIAAGSVPPSSRGRAITLTNCGGSVGGVSAALMLAVGGAAVTWKTFFLVAAFGAVAIMAIAWWLLPESTKQAEDRAAQDSVRDVFFRNGRRKITVLLWSATFFLSLVYFSLGNWTPIFLSERGFAPSQIGAGTMTLTVSAMVGALLLATLLDRGRRELAVATAFLGAMFAVAAFTIAWSVPTLIASMALIGLTVFGGQLLLYAIVPGCYAPQQRATSLGAATAVGRIAGLIGPPSLGFALDAGLEPRFALLPLAPALILSGLCTFQVVRRRPTVD